VTGHTVTFGGGAWSIAHPLACRARQGGLLACPVHWAASDDDWTDHADGTYAVYESVNDDDVISYFLRPVEPAEAPAWVAQLPVDGDPPQANHDITRSPRGDQRWVEVRVGFWADPEASDDALVADTIRYLASQMTEADEAHQPRSTHGTHPC